MIQQHLPTVGIYEQTRTRQHMRAGTAAALLDGCHVSALSLLSSAHSHSLIARGPAQQLFLSALIVRLVIAGWSLLCHLIEHVKQDLNQDPALRGFADSSFDLVTCALSIDYFTDPRAVLEEAGRVLKPGGLPSFH